MKRLILLPFLHFFFLLGYTPLTGFAQRADLAPTPPMGWNSWNCFKADINETLIREIADAMVSSGMRDAGYEYLVLDDGWMAKERDAQGNLQADPEKFPHGMKAIGDYIHHKGLKFGIYECRGYLTCQQLPGSFGHEQADMNIFASWGVDYIKLDACFAERNGRLSSEDLKIYRECIDKTGRPMVLSISDFGNGAWTWGGERYGQLWRTSYDIYPWIENVYHHANTSGGDLRIHPAFNGLWQFAGPGHWNDPDMLEVGHLKTEAEDRAHFSLWCMLAAPLMAGNDLRNMSDTVATVLTAPEVIAINQDLRGHQGYKVFDNGKQVIYNKPLNDGTTAVLLLNTDSVPSDIQVNWEQIGLTGKQRVRDLWARKNLGKFKKSFLARQLPQNGLYLLKVGMPGGPLVPGPAPVPLEKYAVTKSGITYLSDLYYIMKYGAAPVMDQNYHGDLLKIRGVSYSRGIACRKGTKLIYKLNGKAGRFKALVGLDDLNPKEATGRFRIYNEDSFGADLLFDSGRMTPDSSIREVDIDVSGLDGLLLQFDSKNGVGDWALARVVAYPDTFYAYYTREHYTIPLKKAIPYIPQEIDGESRRMIDRINKLSGRDAESFHREIPPDSWYAAPITGEYPDIRVNIKGAGQLIFSRESSYLPKWKTVKGEWLFDELINRQLDIACLYSYARIIAADADSILIEWRYLPDLKKVDMTRVVHETFTIKPDGRVIRRIRPGNEDLIIWKDPGNEIIQTLQLFPDGIRQVSLQPAILEKSDQPAVKGTPVKKDFSIQPVAWWKMDEGLRVRPFEDRDLTLETESGWICRVNGNCALWKQGVSGTALAFDGYHSVVVCPASRAPEIKDQLTVEAWVVLGAYPWNWAPVVHQSIMDPGPIQQGTQDRYGKTDPREKGQGYYLGIDPYGHPVFIVNDKVLRGPEKIATYRWTHLAGSYGDGMMRLFLDGRECGSQPVTGTIRVPRTDLLIGLNNTPGRVSDPVRGPLNNLPRIYGLEGLIDEVKIYDTLLSTEEIASSYRWLRPDDREISNPDLEQRILPGQPGVSDSFGATCTVLKYHDLWDNLWRSGDRPDVVIKFDRAPVSVVFWQGTNGGAGWVTENNKWMADQSLETGGPHGCSEHMSDKECRYAYVRILENTPARVVVHWRYASVDIGYLFPTARHWTDEYYYIYPDATATRYVVYQNGEGGWQDIQFLSQPGTDALDNIHFQALSVANLKGEEADLTWEGTNGVPRNPLTDANIALVNLKSKYKVFLIYPDGEHIRTWGRSEQSAYTPDPFAGPWNHWPVSQMPSDGRYAVDNDRLTHAALGGGSEVYHLGNCILYGLTDQPVTHLVPLARMWNHPPELTDIEGFSFEGFSRSQRAFMMTALDRKLSFSINGSITHPVVNPAFIIRDWGGNNALRVLVNGEIIKGENLRQGVTYDMDGSPMLAVWMKLTATEKIHLKITH